MTQKNLDEPIGYTVEGVLAKAGGRGAVARRLGISVQGVNKWRRAIPSHHATEIAIMAGLPIEIVRPSMVRSHA